MGHNNHHKKAPPPGTEKPVRPPAAEKTAAAPHDAAKSKPAHKPKSARQKAGTRPSAPPAPRSSGERPRKTTSKTPASASVLISEEPLKLQIVALRRDKRRLSIALVASFILHALLLSIHFSLPYQPPKNKRENTLEIVLVNARHEKAPEKAEALAQANLDGGGTIEKENVRPSTPLPPQKENRDGDTLVDMQKQTVEQPVAPQPVLTQPKKNTSHRSTPTPTEPIEVQQVQQVSGLDLLDSAAAAAQLEAQIERKLQEYASRPRRKAISARTREYRFAQYIESWRQKIERVGTLNYPQAARGRLYGKVLVQVSIKADGSVEDIVVSHSSGEPILDEAAINIIRMSAPFASFPDNIRSDTDILVISSTLTFTNNNRLGAQLSN